MQSKFKKSQPQNIFKRWGGGVPVLGPPFLTTSLGLCFILSCTEFNWEIDDNPASFIVFQKVAIIHFLFSYNLRLSKIKRSTLYSHGPSLILYTS